MDTEILKKIEEFRKNEAALKAEVAAKSSTSGEKASNNHKPIRLPYISALNINNYKTVDSTSPFRFSILATIVKYLRAKYQKGDNNALTLEEILDETQQFTVTNDTKTWLLTEALINNPKLQVVDGDRFAFKPVYNITNGKSLMRFLRRRHRKGLGGVFIEDVQESFPNCDKILRNRADEVAVVVRPADKKKVLLYKDRTTHIKIDEDFQKLWRLTNVNSLEDSKIEDYLTKHGITFMKNHAPRKTTKEFKRRKYQKRKQRQGRPKDNKHVSDLLQYYDENAVPRKI